MKTGRNQPCPCGSGKKYKACCLKQDQKLALERSALELAAPPAPLLAPLLPPPSLPPSPPLPPPPPDPHIEAVNAFWDEFEAADYEGRIGLFRRSLDDPELLDGELAFEMISRMQRPAAAQDDRARFIALIDELRERRPEVYRSEAAYLASVLLDAVLGMGDHRRVPALLRELAEHPEQAGDLFDQALDQVAYHGLLDALVELVETTTTEGRARRGAETLECAVSGADTFNILLFAALERDPELPVPNPELYRRLSRFADIREPRFEQYLAHVTGRAGRQWTMEDFAFAKRRRRDGPDLWDEEDEGADAPPPDAARLNLYDLSVEFLGYLRREEGVPYPKGELARAALIEYLLERFDGDLRPRQPLMQTLKEGKPPPFPKPEHVLCPDRDSFDRYLDDRLSLFAPRFHRMAAALELAPAWLRFLESRGLIDADRHGRTLRRIAGLVPEFLEFFEKTVDQPEIVRNLRRWTADAGLAALPLE